MNKLLTLFFLVITLTLAAQSVERYSFSHRIETYKSIDSLGINIVEGFIWDDDLIIIPLEFSLNLFGKPTEGIVGVTNGFLYHPDEAMSNFPKSIVLLYADFVDLGKNSSTQTPESPIYILTTGIVGERVATLEFNNAGFFSRDPTIRDFVNFQMKLYEKDHAIEMHFGTSEVLNLQEIFGFFPGPFIGIAYNTNYDMTTNVIKLDTFLYVKGDQTGFSAVHSNTSTNLRSPDIYFSGWPKENQVFRFSPQMVIANRDLIRTELKVFPNPYHEKFIVQSQEPNSDLESLQLKNSLGQNVSFEAHKISDRIIEIKTDAQLPSGVYLLTWSSQNGVISKSVVKR